MVRSSTFRLPLFLLIALLLPLSACDSGGSNDDEVAVEDGRVNVSISGEASGSFEGFAYFFDATDPNTGQAVFGLVLSNADTETPSMNSQFVVIARLSSRPGPGTYNFADIDEDADLDDLQPDQFIALVSSAVADEDIVGFYVSDGGSLTIERSSDDEVAGSFRIDATGFELSPDSQQPTEVDVTIEGAFDANPSPNPFLPFGRGTTS